MATEIRWRGGSTLEHSTFTGAPKEVTVDTSKKTLVVHDGSTVGGYPLAKQSYVEGVLTDFYGTVDPATIVENNINPGASWADSLNGLIKRRNDTNDGWIVEGVLFKRHIPEYTVAPVTDVGPIYLTGEGPAEWSATAMAYVPIGGGAKGGGADKVFYLNNQTVTEDYTIPTGQNAGAFGPITIADGVELTVSDGSVLTIV